MATSFWNEISHGSWLTSKKMWENRGQVGVRGGYFSSGCGGLMIHPCSMCQNECTECWCHWSGSVLWCNIKSTVWRGRGPGRPTDFAVSGCVTWERLLNFSGYSFLISKMRRLNKAIWKDSSNNSSLDFYLFHSGHLLIITLSLKYHAIPNIIDFITCYSMIANANYTSW